MNYLLQNRLRVIISVLFLLLMACNQGTTQSAAVKLLPPSNGKIYFSAFPDFGGTEDIVSKDRIDDFHALSKKKMVWASFSQNWFLGMEYPEQAIHAIHEAGVIPYVRFMPRSHFNEFEKEPVYNLQNIINGNFDDALHQWAKAARADNIPLIIDFAVEMNGNWFSWSGALNGAGTKDGYGNKNCYDGAERYRDAYRHIIDIFRSESVNHVTWFFHPDITSNPQKEWNKPKYYYPGDDYIDWIGISIYGPIHPEENYWENFSEKLQESYKDIAAISSQKPFAVVEFGVTDHHSLGSKTDWLKDAFNTILSGKYLEFKAINYWHENWDNNGSISSLRIDSSLETLNTFQKLINNPRFISKD